MAGAANPLDSQYQRFAYIVSRGTGLDGRVVEAWVLAEGGPHDNPLNIGPGKHYGSADKAASATIALLRKPLYRPVILSQKTHDPQRELDAIAASPWVGPDDPMKGKRYRQLLGGTFARVTHEPQTPSGTTLDIPGGPKVHVDPSSWGSEAGSLLVTGFAYLVPATVAIVLFALGASRAFGVTPAGVAGAARARREAIPF